MGAGATLPLAIAAGLHCIVSGWLGFARESELDKNRAHCAARVTAVRAMTVPRSPFADVDYTFRAGGVEYHGTSRISLLSANPPAAGKLIAIVYERRDPAHSRVDGSLGPSLSAARLAGGVLLLLGVPFAYWLSRRLW